MIPAARALLLVLGGVTVFTSGLLYCDEFDLLSHHVARPALVGERQPRPRERQGERKSPGLRGGWDSVPPCDAPSLSSERASAFLLSSQSPHCVQSVNPEFLGEGCEFTSQ